MFQKIVKEIIPTISRNVAYHGGKGYNGVYNQDLSENVFLVEVGGKDNTKEEVDYLMGLLLKMFMRDAKKLVREGFRVVVLQKRLPAKGALFAKIQKRIDELEQLSAQLSDKDFNGTTLALCFNYGGHMEIVEAAEKLAASGQEFTEENFAKFIYHPEIPACDLIVRTSGEERISGRSAPDL